MTYEVYMSGTVNGHCTLRLKAMENESPTSKFLFKRCIFFILVQCTLLFFFHLFFKRIKGNCFIYNVKFSGLNFPPNGPVMQKKTQGWEPNTERLYARDGMLIGNNFMALKLEGGGHYTCEFLFLQVRYPNCI